METQPGAQGAARATRHNRSSDRKAQIAAAAARLFQQVGYHNVGIDEVAAAVGITGSAVYRHFRNKQDLLTQVILHGLGLAESVIDEAVAGDRSGWPAIDQLLRGLVTLILDRRDLAVLWQRESRNLPASEQGEFRRRIRDIESRVTGMLRAARPELAASDADLLAWSALAAVVSPAHHRVALPRARFEELLHRMGTTVLASAVVDATDTSAGLRSGGTGKDGQDGQGAGWRTQVPTARASRRELVLATASLLFSRYGFYAVSMEDIGAAAGISGPSVYWHFASKSDLLYASLTRGGEGLLLGLSHALSAAATPRQALERVLDSHLGLILEHPDLIGVLESEVIHLPQAERHQVRRVQYDYVSEWVRLLGELRPELTESEARVLVQGVLALANDTIRTGRLRTRTHLRKEVATIGLDMLLKTP